MALVAWDRRPGEMVEAVLGVLMSRRHPTTATRIRPASGDGGIDIYVRDGDLLDVYQVKAFTNPSLTSSQWQQIKASWERFVDHSTTLGLKIRSWYLVRPQNPTIPEQEKLQEIVGEPGFPCEIRGLDFCDGLAAEFPDVIDYYLHDGADRVERMRNSLLTALAGTPSEAPTTLAAVTNRISQAVRSLNDVDPHFNFAFAVSEGRHEPTQPPLDLLAATVLSSTTIDDAATVTVHVVEKYVGATHDRPVRMRIMPRPGNNAAAVRGWADFVDFGIPVAGMDVQVLEADFPGDLSAPEHTREDVQVQISTAPAKLQAEHPKEFTLAVVTADGTTLASVDLATEYITAGLTGAGAAVKATHSTGMMSLLVKLPRDGDASLSIDTNLDLTGLTPAEVLPPLRVLTGLAPENSLSLSVRYGMQLARAHAISGLEVVARHAGALLPVCRALALIQTRCVQHIVIPDFDTFWEAESGGWEQAATLIDERRVIRTWTDLSLTRDPGTPLPEAASGSTEFAVATMRPLEVMIGGTEMHAGFVRSTLETARIADGQHPGAETLRLVPGSSDKCIIEWAQSSTLE